MPTYKEPLSRAECSRCKATEERCRRMELDGYAIVIATIVIAVLLVATAFALTWKAPHVIVRDCPTEGSEGVLDPPEARDEA